MHRYRRSCRILGMGLLVAAGGCALPSARDNSGAAAELVASQIDPPLLWRRDPAADLAARERASALLASELTLDDAIAVAFLVSPEPQIALEQLEISRSELVAASTPPNPIAVVGTRKPGGDLAAFYPEQSISFGVLQNVVALLTMPDRRAVAKLDLARARNEAAQRALVFAADVVAAWLEYSGALQIRALREEALRIVQSAYERRLAEGADEDADARRDLMSQYDALLKEEADAAHARIQEQVARQRLAARLGIAGWREDWTIAADLPPLPAADPQVTVLETQAMRSRLDLAAAGDAIESRLRALATHRRFRWLDQFEIGLFRDKAVGGTTFTGPNAVIEVPLFDQRQSTLLAADAELQIAVRRLQSMQLAARSEIRERATTLAGARWDLEQLQQRVLPHRRAMALEDGSGEAAQAYAGLNDDIEQVSLRVDYWRARAALALAAGDWRGVSGLP